MPALYYEAGVSSIAGSVWLLFCPITVVRLTGGAVENLIRERLGLVASSPAALELLPFQNGHHIPKYMLYLALKAVISGVLIAAASTLAKRYPGFDALIASLPLVSVLGMVWLWNERPDTDNMAAHTLATFWYVIPSLPMFLLIPTLLRHGVSFWFALIVGCALTIVLYTALIWLGPHFGLQL